MSIFHRISVRSLLTSSIVALALGGCSFSYSSGSSPPNSHANHGKPLPKKSSGKVDNSEKPISRSSDEKPITKAPVREPDAPAKADPTPPPERTPDDAAPVRTKGAPKRTTGAPKRTPVADDTVEAEDAGKPNAGTSFKAKTKPATPPTASDTIVAPK